MEEGDRSKCVREVVASSAMVAKYTPVFEPSDGMFDPSSPTAVFSPCLISNDATTAKNRRHELWNSTIATIGEDVPMLETRQLDRGAAIVDRIISISRTTSHDVHHRQVTPTDQDLRIA